MSANQVFRQEDEVTSEASSRGEQYDAVRQIFRSIKPIKPLPKEIEQGYIARAKQGDKDAMETLIRAHLPIVLRLASSLGPRHVPLQDRVQDGIMGLMDAVVRYDDPTGRTPLFSFARWRILMHVQGEERCYREPLLPDGFDAAEEEVQDASGDAEQRRRAIIQLAEIHLSADERAAFYWCTGILGDRPRPAAEVAVLMGRQPGEVRSLLARARATIQRVCREQTVSSTISTEG